MADGFFKKGVNAIMTGLIDLDTDTLKIRLYDGGVADLNNDDFMNDISGTVIGTDVTLGGVTVVDRVFDANDAVYTTVDPADVIDNLVIYKHTGSDATARPIVWIDSALNLPLTALGGPITIVWNNGANKIFKL